MPRCVGLPTGPCPSNQNDHTVRNGEGDLMLCPECDKTRHQKWLASRSVQPLPRNRHPSSISTSTSGTLANTDKTVIVNEVLSYINFYRDKVSMEQMKKVALGYFLPAEVSTAKNLLVGIFAAKLNDCSYKADRCKSSTRTVKEVKLDDIFGIIDFLDVKCKINTVFAAVNLERVPRYSPEDINLSAMVDKQAELGASIAAVAREVKDLEGSSLTTKVEDIVTKALDPVKEQICRLTNIVTQLKKASNNLNATSGTVSFTPTTSATSDSGNGLHPLSDSAVSKGTRRSTVNADKSRNVVIFGVDETRDSSKWRETVLNALHVAAGKEVHLFPSIYLNQAARPIEHRT